MNILKKLHLLDYIILFLILSTLLYFAFYIKSESSSTEITVISRDVPLYLTNSFKGGDFEKDPSGHKIAEIVEKTLYPSRNDNTTTRDLYLTVRLLVQANNKTQEVEYKNKSINVGSPIEFRFNSGIVQGVVIKLGSQTKKNVYRNITVRAYSQHFWIGDKLVVGQGDAEILELLSKEIIPSPPNLVPILEPVTHDQTVDLILKLKVLGEMTKGQFLFANEKPLLIGGTFSFFVGNVFIKDAVITSLDE